MIKFFRHIRQRLLKENKFSKYLLYAIGEIVLVVIGILIALQINNWNIQSKLKVQEETIIQEVERNIESNIAEMKLDLVQISNRINSIETIVAHLNSELVYHDSLALHFGRINSYRYFNDVDTGYQLMMSKGAEEIMNDTLRISLTTYFGEGLEDINHSMMLLQDHYNHYILDIFRLQFEVDASKPFFSTTARTIPIDYNNLKKDKTFINSLNLFKSVHIWTQLMLKMTIENSEQTLMEIKAYMKTNFN
jgi:hypothetical protein